MRGDTEIMAGCWWSWLIRLWLVVGGSGKLMPGRRWLWMVAAKLWLVVGGFGWSHPI